jgi:hypothetical protein
VTICEFVLLHHICVCTLSALFGYSVILSIAICGQLYRVSIIWQPVGHLFLKAGMCLLIKWDDDDAPSKDKILADQPEK